MRHPVSDSTGSRFLLPLSRLSLTFAIVGLAVSIAVAAATFFQSRQASIAVSAADAEVLADAFAQRTRIAQSYLRAVSARIRGADRVTGEEFERFVSLLGPEPALERVVWAPRVSRSDRERFEAQIGRVIRDHGDTQPAPGRAAYFPILFAAGMRADDAELGIDLATLLPEPEALFDTGGLRSTIATPPGQLDSDHPGMHLVEPVPWSGGEAGPGVSGVVVGTFRLDLLMAAAAPAGLISRDVVIQDVTDENVAVPITVHAGADLGVAARDWPHKDIGVGGRTWRVFLEPAPNRAVQDSLVVLLIGLTITGLSVVLADRAQQRLIAQDLRREVTRQTAAFQRSSAEFRALFEEGGTGKCELVPDTQSFRRVNLRLSEMLGYPREELVRMGLADVLAASESAHDAAYADLLSGESDAYLAEKQFRRKDGTLFWCEVSATVLRDEAASPVWTVAVIQDISQRKQAEETRQLLVRELAHRVKNTMQVARSLADQTGRYADDLGSFLTLYQGRLRALAMAHDQLFKTDWTGARLDDLIRGTLAAFESEAASRITLDVPEVFLSSSETQTLALILNELATNAAKHGALAAEAGCVTIRGEVVDGGGEPGEPSKWLAFEWRETGGRPATMPDKTGFGMTFLTRAVQHQHGGSTGFEWREEGLSYTMRLPLHSSEPGAITTDADS